MATEALIFSRDVDLSAALSVTLRRAKLRPVCVSRVGAALHLLRSRKFPAVIVDCEDAAIARDLLELCRGSGSNKSSVVFALAEGPHAATSWGVNFAVKRPANGDMRAFATVLRAAEGMILQDFRRYRRIPLQSIAVLDNDEHRLQMATVNVSEGGMCVRGEISGWNKEHLVQFGHPNINLHVQASSYLVWSRNGHSGIQFRFMSTSSRQALSSWIDSQ